MSGTESLISTVLLSVTANTVTMDLQPCTSGFLVPYIPLIVNFPFLTAKLLPVPARWEHGASGKASVAGLCYKPVPNVNRSIK